MKHKNIPLSYKDSTVSVSGGKGVTYVDKKYFKKTKNKNHKNSKTKNVMPRKDGVYRIKTSKGFFLVGIFGGKKLDRVKWTNGKSRITKSGKSLKMNKRDAVSQFKQSKTFSRNTQNIFLTNLIEKTDYSVKQRKNSDVPGTKFTNDDVRINHKIKKFQWVCHGYIKGMQSKIEISGRSRQYDNIKENYQIARDEAFDHFCRKLATRGTPGKSGEVDEGYKEFLLDKVENFQEGPVYYKQL